MKEHLPHTASDSTTHSYVAMTSPTRASNAYQPFDLQRLSPSSVYARADLSRVSVDPHSSAHPAVYADAAKGAALSPTSVYSRADLSSSNDMPSVTHPSLYADAATGSSRMYSTPVTLDSEVTQGPPPFTNAYASEQRSPSSASAYTQAADYIAPDVILPPALEANHTQTPAAVAAAPSALGSYVTQAHAPLQSYVTSPSESTPIASVQSHPHAQAPSPGSTSATALPLHIPVKEVGPRAWNEEFQRLCVLPRDTPAEQLHRLRAIQQLSSEFTAEATRLSKIIISEVHLESAQRSIKSVDVGGVAGGWYVCDHVLLFFFIYLFHSLA